VVEKISGIEKLFAESCVDTFTGSFIGDVHNESIGFGGRFAIGLAIFREISIYQLCKSCFF
jgi:hypothetical protein